MTKIIYIIALITTLAGCGSKESLKGTIWKLSIKEGSNTLIFSDSTYIAKISHNEKEEQKEFPYSIIGDTIYFPTFGSTTSKGVIKGNELNIYKNELIELQDTFFTNTYQLIYKKQ